jgi:hypothetical protein
LNHVVVRIQLVCCDVVSNQFPLSGVNRDITALHVRFWHKADIPHRVSNVAFGGKADIAQTGHDVCF